MRIQNYVLKNVVTALKTTDLSHRTIASANGASHSWVDDIAHKLSELDLTDYQILSLDEGQLDKLLRPGNQRHSNKVLPDFGEMKKRLQVKHQTQLALWFEYKDIYEDQAYSYSQTAALFKDFLKTLDPAMRINHIPGEKIFVDFAGQKAKYRKLVDATKGIYRIEKAHIFVGVLGASSYTFACAFENEKTESWVEGHLQMYRFFGGVSEVVVPDNAKGVVTKPGKQLILNRTYSEMAHHQGTVVLPARVRKPQDKALAENGVLQVERWILAQLEGCVFWSLDELNKAIRKLLHVLNNKPFKSGGGCRLSRFEELDKPVLKPLPAKPYEYRTWHGRQKVGRDYHITFEGHDYSVSYELMGKYVEVCVGARVVEIYHQGNRVASHSRSDKKGGFTVSREHMPPNHLAYARQNRAGFSEWAGKIGPCTLAVVKAQYKNRHDNSAIAQNACVNLKDLASLHSAEDFEAACRRAERISSMTVKTITQILDKGLQRLEPPQINHQFTLPAHDNVRGPDYFDGGGT